MSANPSPTEPEVPRVPERTAVTSIPNGPAMGRDRPTRFDVERRILCRRIEELEQQLARERRRREQVVDNYERLLDEARENADGCDRRGLLDRLF